MQPVGELVRLCAQRVGEAVHAEPGGQACELGRVAQRRHVTNLMPADEDRATARNEDPFARQQHLILVFQSAREELQEAPLRQHLRDLSSDAVNR